MCLEQAGYKAALVTIKNVIFGLSPLFCNLLNFHLKVKIIFPKLADLVVYEDSLHLCNMLHLFRPLETAFRDAHK